jgi:predicted glycoside hydrolase/deacetylase ChbG (UPF0249 family)
VRRLIVNADDFGLTGGVNLAITELQRCGALTSTTLMARAAATPDALELARATPTLGVGCHVVLVDGEPMLLPSQQIPNLADLRSGLFRPKLGKFLLWLAQDAVWSRHSPAEIEAEASAQIASLQNQGLQLTHIDTHKHTHMFPAVLRPVLRAAHAAGIRAVRNPFEPAWSLWATPGAPWLRRTEVALLRLLEPNFRRIVAEEGMITTDGAIGVLATGTLDATTVRVLLARMPEGTWELVAHPGYNDADLAQARTRLLASRELERTALAAVREFPAIKLITFAEL